MKHMALWKLDGLAHAERGMCLIVNFMCLIVKTGGSACA